MSSSGNIIVAEDQVIARSVETTHGRELSALKALATRSMATLALRYGLVIAISFAGTVVLSRMVGPRIWGIFAIAQVVCLSSQEIFGRGIATYLIKKSGAPSPADIRSTFALQQLLGLVFLADAALLAFPASRWYHSQELVPLLFAAAFASYAYAWRSVPVALLERELDYVKVAFIEILEAATFSGAAIVLAWLGRPITGLVLALALRSLLPTVLAFTLKPVRPQLFFCRDTVSTVADFGLFITGISVINIAILFVPAIFVGKLAGVESLGLAQMAFSLFSNLLFATAAVLRLSFSTYSRLAHYPGELQKTVNNNLETLSMVLAPAIVLFAGLSPAWVPLVFGAKWQLLPELLLAQAPGYLLVAIFWGIINPALVVSGKHRYIFYYLAGSTTVYALLTAVLTPRLGALGVAVAYSANHIVCIPILLRMYAGVHGSLRLKKVFTEIAIGMASVGLLWVAARYSIAATAGVLVAYSALWYLRNSHVINLIRVFLRGLLSGVAISPQQEEA
jgi:O-antigen/teichoic acid export membrane protein